MTVTELKKYHIWIQTSFISSWLSKEWFKVTSGKTKTMCTIYPNLSIKSPERRHWRCSSVFIVKFEYAPHIVSVRKCRFSV